MTFVIDGGHQALKTTDTIKTIWQTLAVLSFLRYIFSVFSLSRHRFQSLKTRLDISTNLRKPNTRFKSTTKKTESEETALLRKAKRNENAYDLTHICIMSPGALCGKKITQKFHITWFCLRGVSFFLEGRVGCET